MVSGHDDEGEEEEREGKKEQACIHQCRQSIIHVDHTHAHTYLHTRFFAPAAKARSLSIMAGEMEVGGRGSLASISRAASLHLSAKDW